MRPRNAWLLARIIGLNGHPGPIRSVKLQMPNGRITTRPVNKICPLEAGPEQADTQPVSNPVESFTPIEEEQVEGPGLLEPQEQDNQLIENQPPTTIVNQKPKEPAALVSKHKMVTRGKAKLGIQSILAACLLTFIINPIFGFTSPIKCEGCPTCHGCLVHCSKAGVNVLSPPKISKIEICCLDRCQLLPGQEETIHQLPKEILVNDYTCHAKFWDTNREIPFEVSTKCLAFHQCQLVDCTFCLDLLTNPTCNPMAAALVLIGICFPLLLVLSCCCKSLQTLLRPLGVIWRLTRPLYIWGRRRGSKALSKGREYVRENQTNIKENARKFKKGAQKRGKEMRQASLARLARYGIIPALLLLIAHLIIGEPISIISQTENCRVREGTRICTILSSTTLSLLPAGQPTTLLIKDRRGDILGALMLTLKALTINCNPRTLTYLRSYRISTRSVWRCPSGGSCSGSFCSQVGANTHIPELVEVMDKPGSSGCLESSALWSKGCGFPTASCYFYRWYAIPMTLDVFELFECPTWDFHIKTTLQLTVNDQMVEETVTLHPGLTHHWANISLTPISVTNPPAPVLSTPFLTHGFSVALGDGVPTDLKCQDRPSVARFGCNISANTCKDCRPTPDGSITCQCREFDGEAILADPAKRLPLTIGRHTFLTEDDQVYVEQSYTPLQINLQMNNFQLVTEITESTCRIVVNDM
ncbi:unnamed protein product [Meloidogyne enterolobii]|uniref:Uncharacterized protein n=1 Tax=Meloidogyne enterolobii TaxID=390850 RepID=A0ACB0XT48_MELEN